MREKKRTFEDRAKLKVWKSRLEEHKWGKAAQSRKESMKKEGKKGNGKRT